MTNTKEKREDKLPKYRCHKEVWALKIKEVVPVYKPRLMVGKEIGAYIIPEDKNFEEFEVSIEYYKKHLPKAGGYWVLYQDGYESFSPAEAFEGGYTLLKE